MKKLALKTLEKAFKEIGFDKSHGGMYLGRYQTNEGRIGLTFPKNQDGNILLEEARWTKRGNVHIVSYWRWPSSMKDLKTMIDDIIDTYTTLCASKFYPPQRPS